MFVISVDNKPSLLFLEYNEWRCSVNLGSMTCFYPLDVMLYSAGLCDIDVFGRPDVRPTHAGIVPSTAKAGS